MLNDEELQNLQTELFDDVIELTEEVKQDSDKETESVPPRKRRRWPWIAAPLTALFMIVAAAVIYISPNKLRSTLVPRVEPTRLSMTWNVYLYPRISLLTKRDLVISIAEMRVIPAGYSSFVLENRLLRKFIGTIELKRALKDYRIRFYPLYADLENRYYATKVRRSMGKLRKFRIWFTSETGEQRCVCIRFGSDMIPSYLGT